MKREKSEGRSFLLLNQTFYPDVVATAQYLSEVARELAGRGHRVTVVTSRHAYDDPDRLFPREETWRGVRILRVNSTVLGKRTRWRRGTDFASFMFFCVLRLLRLPRHDVVVALTSPPLIALIGAWLAKLRGSRFYYWVMDLNPDQAIAAGWLRAGSPPARMLEWMSRFALNQATRIIVLDRFMRDRLRTKGIPARNIVVIPPWSHDDEVEFDHGGRARFRQQHGLEGKFVVMYSGNHSPCHPLETMLQVARRLAEDPGVVFCFVGGGSGWQRMWRERERQKRERGDRREEIGVRTQKTGAGLQSSPSTLSSLPSPVSAATGGGNIVCLPYQPLAGLGASLSAADLHVVVMGDAMVGIVHPCKIYNILNVAAHVLFIGPKVCHITELLLQGNGHLNGNGNGNGKRNGTLRLSNGAAFIAVRHGEVERVVQAIRKLRAAGSDYQRSVPEALRCRFSKEVLLPRLVSELEGPNRKAESRKQREETLSFMRLLCLILVASLAVSSARGQTPMGTNAPAAAMGGNSLLATNTSRLPSSLIGYVPDDKYKLRVGDRVAFQITEDRDLPKALTVADSGELDFPYIGRVAAVDKTCKQMAQECKALLEKEYYYHATVIIALDAANRFLGRIYVWGQVRNQGPIDIAVNENLTAGKAILRAGGFGDFANKKRVKVVRAGANGAAKQSFELNMIEILEEAKTEKDVLLQPDDFIIVPSRLVNF